jgi:hypothetical protein
MMSVKRVRECGRGECGLTFSPARGIVCSKRGGIREVSAEDKKTNFSQTLRKISSVTFSYPGINVIISSLWRANLFFVQPVFLIQKFA